MEWGSDSSSSKGTVDRNSVQSGRSKKFPHVYMRRGLSDKTRQLIANAVPHISSNITQVVADPDTWSLYQRTIPISNVIRLIIKTVMAS